MNTNANFWASDGIAALGRIGVSIALVCVRMFAVLDTVTGCHNRLFVVLCFLPIVATLGSVGVFQSVFSGGGCC